jgi:hypothetical protein
MKNSYGSLANIFVSIVIVVVVCYGTVYFSRFSFIEKFSPFLPSSNLFLLFEHHFWQFVFSMIVIVVLSRGHLWSYGINSKNLKLSMKYLGWIYLVTITLMCTLFMAGVKCSPIAITVFPMGVKNSILSMLIFWMSAPVANTILFFGLGQTIISKRFTDLDINDPFFMSIIIPSVLYVFISTATQFVEIGTISLICAFTIAVVSSMMYRRTGSLIAPMLGQAFFFGFPLFIQIATTIQL